MPLLSLVIPSRRPHKLVGLLDSIEKTITDFSSVEVLVKIDDDMPGALETIEKEVATRPFTIRYLNTPRLGGVFTLWAGLDDLFAMSDPESYFLMALTDESQFLTPGWDDILKNYVGFFDDDVFRLRVSDSKFVNYSHHFSCCTKPECFPIFTRRWLELTEGICNLCYGSDCYQQSIAFHLALGKRSYLDVWQEEAYFRDVQVHDITFGGFEFGQDISPTEALTRSLYMYREWKRINSYQEQRNIAYLAKKITLYCWAMQKGHREFHFSRRKMDDTVAVIDHATGAVLRRISYHPPRFMIYVRNLFLDIIFSRHQFRLFLFQLTEGARPDPEMNAPSKMPAFIREGLNMIGNIALPIWKPIYFVVRIFGFYLCVLLLRAIQSKAAATAVISTVKKLEQKPETNGFLSILRDVSERSSLRRNNLRRKLFAITNRFSRYRPPMRIQIARLLTNGEQWRIFTDAEFRGEQRKRMWRTIFMIPVNILRISYLMARETIYILGPLGRYLSLRTFEILFKPLDFMTKIPPAGLERPQPYNPISFWYRFRKTGYPVADYKTMHEERDRFQKMTHEWAGRVYRQNTPSSIEATTSAPREKS